MSVIAGGSNGITYPDATNTPAASITTIYSPAITDTTNIMSVQAGAKFIGTTGVYANGYIYPSNAVTVSYTVSSNTANLAINLSQLPNYVPGISNITITINSGVYVYSTSTANAALAITGGHIGDTLTIVNNGYIMGMGGSGVYSNPSSESGGSAISLPSTAIINTTIDNTNASAYIGGGGGGGGGAISSTKTNIYYTGGGGGAGGGAGGDFVNSVNTVLFGAGGAGGSIGASGSNGIVGNATYGQASSGGGGRVFPSTSTTLTAGGGQTAGLGGSGGGTGNITAPSGTANETSVGGGPGQAGSATGTTSSGTAIVTGGGGGWGSAGGSSYINNVVQRTGGAGGNAVKLNGNTVTWVAGNTTRVYGAVA